MATVIFSNTVLANPEGLEYLNINLLGVYSLNGTDNVIELENRVINPDGDNSMDFFSPDALASSQTIIAQNISSTSGSREFQLYVDTAGTLQLIFGGVTSQICTAAQGFEPNKHYWLTLTGTSFTLAETTDDNIIRSGSFIKGAAREPSAKTTVGARTNGSIGVYAAYFNGLQYNVGINGTRWDMTARNQAVQVSSPPGNNMTILNMDLTRWQNVP